MTLPPTAYFQGEGTFAGAAGCAAAGSAASAVDCGKSEELQLATVYTAGMTLAACGPLPLGLLIDRCGSAGPGR
jgi:hypothetical protein